MTNVQFDGRTITEAECLAIKARDVMTDDILLDFAEGKAVYVFDVDRWTRQDVTVLWTSGDRRELAAEDIVHVVDSGERR